MAQINKKYLDQCKREINLTLFNHTYKKVYTFSKDPNNIWHKSIKLFRSMYKSNKP